MEATICGTVTKQPLLCLFKQCEKFMYLLIHTVDSAHHFLFQTIEILNSWGLPLEYQLTLMFAYLYQRNI